MHKTLILILAVVSFACLSPEEIDYSADQEIVALDKLLDRSMDVQVGYQIDKKVILDGIEETTTMPFETLVLQKDLGSLRDFTYSRLIRSASYNMTQSENERVYSRKDGENKGPVSLKISKSNGVVSNIQIVYVEENILYRSDRSIELYFDDNRLSKYRLTGNRKLIGMDPTSFEILASISQI